MRTIRHVVLFGLLLAFGVMSTARADDFKALQAMTWLHRINEVDTTILAERDVAAANREMELSASWFSPGGAITDFGPADDMLYGKVSLDYAF